MPEIRKVLIANRGEIACRIIEACRRKAYATVAVFSDADRQARHVHLAEEAVYIGPSLVSQSYLVADKILAACAATGADAVHPGYGFLSENAEFARKCLDAGLTFIGPSPQAIALMGNKAAAKRFMEQNNVPCIPGYQGVEQGDDRLHAEAQRIGFPVMIKAAAGGGGRGMRLVECIEEFDKAVARARSEALNAFGSDELILERAIRNARHVEIQVIADGFGSVIHLGERDCSVQRRHQKVIEEAPSPVMDAELRQHMGASAVTAAKSINYTGAGTVEFLVDDDRNYYFLEMNTRLQVEHPVTELVTGLDIVGLQLDIAAGRPLPFTQNQVTITGHAIEARLYAEDAYRNFLPQAGRIDLLELPQMEGVRVDHGLVEGYEISPFYDPMLAKVIAYGTTRDEARLKLKVALKECVIVGVETNNEFLRAVLVDDLFAAGKATTAFLSDFTPPLREHPADNSAIICLSALLHADLEMASLPEGFRYWTTQEAFIRRARVQMGDRTLVVSITRTNKGYTLACDRKEYELTRFEHDGRMLRFDIDGVSRKALFRTSGEVLHLVVDGMVFISENRTHHTVTSEDEGMDNDVRAPMNGRVLNVFARPEERVNKGDLLIVMEAMKMEHQLTAPVSGAVTEVAVDVGSQVDTYQLLLRIEPDAA